MSLIATGLTRRIEGVAHLDGVSCALERGGFYVVVGPTMSGKTSLLHALAGLNALDAGKITLDGADLATVPVWSRSVSMVYQQFINYPHLTVFENIAFPLRRRRVERAELERRVRTMAETVGLTPLLERLPGALSGGQQQRVALARSLVKGSDLLLLDEPLVNLDYKLREQLREEFLNISALRAVRSSSTRRLTRTKPFSSMPKCSSCTKDDCCRRVRRRACTSVPPRRPWPGSSAIRR